VTALPPAPADLGHDAAPGSVAGPTTVLARRLVHAVAEAPPDELLGILGVLAQAQAMALARLKAPCPGEDESRRPEGNISVREAASTLGVSKSYLYKNAEALPFVLRIGRRVVCSRVGLQKWQRARQRA
jgi:hypothetical protein